MIVLDAEFTGLNPEKHSLISLGALDFYNPENQFYVECLPWEGAKLDEEALLINGFTEEKIDSLTKTLQLAMLEFDKWTEGVEDLTFAGQNVGYLDLAFITNSYERYHINFKFPHRTVDVHTLTYMHLIKRGESIPVENGKSLINSTFVQDYTGIPEEPKPHNALNGAKVAGEAISRLLYGKNLLPEFKDYPVPKYLG